MWALAEKYALRGDDLGYVARGKHKQAFGWFLSGTDVGWPCGRKTFKDEVVRVFNHIDGRIVTGTQMEIAQNTNLDQRDVSAVLRERRKSARGWMLPATFASGYTPRGANDNVRDSAFAAAA